MTTERRAIAAAVAAAHVLLWLGLRALGPPGDRQPPRPDPAPLVVQLMLPPPPPDAPRPAPPARPRATPPVAPALQVPSIAALPALPAPPPAAPAAESLAPAIAPATPPPLVLDLPRAASAPRSVRSLALEDLRSNSPRSTVETRIAAVTGSTELVAEPLGDGRIRYRRGNQCVIAIPSRDGELDPFNTTTSPRLRGIQPC